MSLIAHGCRAFQGLDMNEACSVNTTPRDALAKACAKLSVGQAAAFLGLSKSTLDKLRSKAVGRNTYFWGEGSFTTSGTSNSGPLTCPTF